jgi:Uma2 family endonuclease
MAVQITLRPISVSEYTRMREVGILREDDRVELIVGEIRQMSPIGPLHAAIVNRLAEMLISMLKQSATVGIQGPIKLNDMSVPQPDLVVLKRRDDFYSTEEPSAQVVLLVIEVSDTTADYDRTEKMPRYGSAVIPEAWLIDLNRQQIEQYTQPRKSGYRDMRLCEAGDRIQSASAPGIAFDIDAMFGLS